MDDLTSQALSFGTEIWKLDCLEVNLSVYPFIISVKNDTIKTRSVIISTGAEALWLNADRESEFKGKGISTCATCDGFLFRNKSVIVIGGGDSAMEEANFLTKFASTVTIIHRKETFKASKIMLNRVRNNPKIKFLLNSQVLEWSGSNNILSGAVIKNILTNITEHIECDGAFIAIGHKPNTNFLHNQIELHDNGYIKLFNNTMTSVPGVFACEILLLFAIHYISNFVLRF